MIKEGLFHGSNLPAGRDFVHYKKICQTERERERERERDTLMYNCIVVITIKNKKMPFYNN